MPKQKHDLSAFPKTFNGRDIQPKTAAMDTRLGLLAVKYSGGGLQEWVVVKDGVATRRASLVDFWGKPL